MIAANLSLKTPKSILVVLVPFFWMESEGRSDERDTIAFQFPSISLSLVIPINEPSVACELLPPLDL